MYSLTVKSAFAYVRRAIDELVSAESIGLLADPDALDLHKIVEGSIVEAVAKIHSQAPTLLMEGEVAVRDEDYSLEIEDGVATIAMLVPALRVISVKSDDSDVIVCDLLAENSPEGRMQLNAYTRGVHDDPRAVLQKKWNGDNMPVIKYYTTNADDPEFEVEYFPYPVLEEGEVKISPRLEYAVLNEIVAMVLDIYREGNQAQIFRAKALEYMGGKG